MGGGAGWGRRAEVSVGHRAVRWAHCRRWEGRRPIGIEWRTIEPTIGGRIGAGRSKLSPSELAGPSSSLGDTFPVGESGEWLISNAMLARFSVAE